MVMDGRCQHVVARGWYRVECHCGDGTVRERSDRLEGHLHGAQLEAGLLELCLR